MIPAGTGYDGPRKSTEKIKELAEELKQLREERNVEKRKNHII